MNNEKNTKETKEAKAQITPKSIYVVFEEAYGTHIGREAYPALLYLVNSGYNFKESRDIFDLCRNSKPSFEELDAIARLYRYCGKDKEKFRKIGRNGFGQTFKAETIAAINDWLELQYPVPRLEKIVDVFQFDEKMLINALIISGKCFAKKYDEEIQRVIVSCRSKEALLGAMEMYQRGAYISDIMGILVKYEASETMQVTALKRENAKLKIKGTIRDSFKYTI